MNTTCLHPDVWFAHRTPDTAIPVQPSGFAALDAQLPGGGWPVGMLTEFICRSPGVGELRLLIPLLQRLTREGRTVILLGPPHLPHAPALASFGIDLQQILIVQTPQPADRLWAIEQSLRSAHFGVLLAWLPHDRTRPEHLRRMQLAAQGSRGPAILLRDLPAQHEVSPAPLRLLLLPRPGQTLQVQILKRRGPVLDSPITLALPHPPTAIHPTIRPRLPTPQASPAPVHLPSGTGGIASTDPASVWH